MKEYIKLAWHFFYLGVNSVLLAAAQASAMAITFLPMLSVIVIIEQMFQYVKSIIILVTFKEMDIDVKINTYTYLKKSRIETFTSWLVLVVAGIAFSTVGFMLTAGTLFLGITLQMIAYFKIMFDSEMQEIKDLDDTKINSIVKSVNSDLADYEGKYE